MLWICRDCTAAYSVGAAPCPQCGSTNYEEEGMPKITVAGGPSNADADTATSAQHEQGGDESSPGNSSSASDKTPSPNSTPSDTSGQPPAPTTANPSGKAQKAASTARSTGGAKKTAAQSAD